MVNSVASTDAATTRPGRAWHVVLWVIQVLGAVSFCLPVTRSSPAARHGRSVQRDRSWAMVPVPHRHAGDPRGVRPAHNLGCAHSGHLAWFA